MLVGCMSREDICTYVKMSKFVLTYLALMLTP